MIENNIDSLMNRIRKIEIYTRRLVKEGFAGDYHSAFKGMGMEFDEVRQYTVGDDIRTIDWNVTARYGELFVKKYIEERELSVMLVVDVSCSQYFGTRESLKRELISELSAILSFSAISNNDKVGLLLFSDRIEYYVKPKKGRSHVLRLIKQLISFRAKRKATDISVALESVHRLLRQPSIVFIISDFLVDPKTYEQSLQILGRRHDVIAFDVSDVMESDIEDVGLLTLEDAETGEVMTLDTGNMRWREAFRKYVLETKKVRGQQFTKHRIDYANFRLGDDYLIGLSEFFKNRVRRLKTRM